jgi:uncharacterized protein YegL
MASPGSIYKVFQIKESIYATYIKGYATEIKQPIHLCVLIDTSGSMEENNKLNNVITSLTFLLDHMSSNDYLSVITFDITAKLKVINKKLTEEGKVEIKTIIASLVAGGGTNMSDALQKSSLTLMKDTNFKQCILLLTDGHANIGSINPDELIPLVTNSISYTSFTSIGYGTDHNTNLLKSIATEGGGSYNVVSSLEDTASVFGDILGGLQTCIAQNVLIEYPTSSELLTSYAIRNNDVYIGDLQSESEVYVFSNKQPIGISGKNLDGSHFIAVPVFDSSNNEQIITAYKRQQVASLMSDIQKDITVVGISDEKKAIYREKIIILQGEIQGMLENEMKDLLLNQLNKCIDILDTSHLDLVNVTVLMSQNSTAIGTGRGMISGDAHYGIMSPFANSIQRNISTGMRTHAQSVRSQRTLSYEDHYELLGSQLEPMPGGLPGGLPGDSSY